ncbi:peptide MFS transporter [Pleionea sp. CnH1-48]|uniref:peptide MFS transporter n=1 Tax=Pleionea sp. CnH1-48 TaxID=2954494 RepID=UPI002097B562|nr:oligopeptide:H+ symporter [Pleionea sp. CnH1-48]MCO7223917.1 oligopeptide:H+ symporter [Pleionea sp. CnH1-48]
MTTSVSDAAPMPKEHKDFMGHPKGLWMLFSAEFWERFSYYGMRAILAPYVALQFFSHLGNQADAEASLTYGGYTSMVYMTGILGGYVADKMLGYQRSIMLGGSLMAAGLFMSLSPDLTMFLMGLALLVVGNGLFKPNISTMVGKLYDDGDPRRDSGFTIFYMGINAGALIAPIICGTWIGAVYGYKWGFFTAGIGMVLGLMVFQLLKSWLDGVGKAPEGVDGKKSFIQVLIGAAVLVAPVFILLSRSHILGIILSVMMLALAGYFVYSGIRSGSKEQLHRYIAMLILFVANMFFWALFEQAGSSLNFFARDYVSMPEWMDFTLFQSANPIFIIILAPIFAYMWPRLDKWNMNPSTPRKFAFGLLGVGLGFYILVFAIQFMLVDGKVPWQMLALCYLIHTMGELCLSPIGLSMVTKLALPKETGLAMGGWFLSIATANYMAGRIAAIAAGGGGQAEAGSIEGYAAVFDQLFWGGLIVAIFFFVVAPFVNKLMHGVK